MRIAPDVELPDKVLQQHIGVLGKTGSGKTSTAKLIVERVVEEGARVCILDPIKSDWWGLTVSADGRGPGLPFDILGGPKAHVPIHAGAGEAIGRLVATGALRLSIIDMADFDPGEHAKFFIAFAQALFRHATGVVYLVVEEAHIFAPKDRAGIGEETKSIHWMSKLATAARSKGIRLLVCTQRTQKLHNDVLGSCETLVVHRLTMPADQKPVVDWLRANTSAQVTAEISGSLSSLKTGEGWICSGEAQLVRRVAFPRISTFDNTSTPTGDADAVQVHAPPVDLERLRAIVGEAIAEAEDSDVEVLRAKVRRLTEERDAARKSTASAEEVRRLRAERDELARRLEAERRSLEANAAAILNIKHIIDDLMSDGPRHGPPALTAEALASVPADRNGPVSIQSSIHAPRPAATPARQPSVATMAPGLTGPQQRLIDALAWWDMVGVSEPTRVQVAWIAGYTASSGTFRTLLSEARSLGLMEYCGTGQLYLLPNGRDAATWPERPGTLREMHDRIRSRLTGPQQRIFEVLVDRHRGEQVDRASVAKLAGYEATSGTFRTLLSECKSLGLLVYPSTSTVQASRLLFPEGLR